MPKKSKQDVNGFALI